MRDRPVLLHLLAQGHLGAEGLVGRLRVSFYQRSAATTDVGQEHPRHGTFGGAGRQTGRGEQVEKQTSTGRRGNAELCCD